MCLSVPVRIAAVESPGWATVEASGSLARVSTELIGPVEQGDWVLVHAGLALEKLDETQAAETLELLEALAAADAAVPQQWADLLAAEHH